MLAIQVLLLLEPLQQPSSNLFRTLRILELVQKGPYLSEAQLGWRMETKVPTLAVFL
jgi:hypothetical protein